jgi:hypothetical protein
MDNEKIIADYNFLLDIAEEFYPKYSSSDYIATALDNLKELEQSTPLVCTEEGCEKLQKTIKRIKEDTDSRYDDEITCPVCNIPFKNGTCKDCDKMVANL